MCPVAVIKASERRMKNQVLACLLVVFGMALAGAAAPTGNVCQRELEHANRTMANWAQTMEELVNESKLPAKIRETVHSEANQILDLIEDFGAQLSSQTASQLARDLVVIRRRSNRMALDIYLNTFDMRWPQNSLGLGITVERVQQACLDRLAVQALESPPQPLAPLLIN